MLEQNHAPIVSMDRPPQHSQNNKIFFKAGRGDTYYDISTLEAEARELEASLIPILCYTVKAYLKKKTKISQVVAAKVDL